MLIDTSILQHVIVEIEGNEYPVAEKSIAVCEKVDAIIRDAFAKNAGTLTPEKMMEAVGILLGKDAQKALFPNGKQENYDRICLIYNGVREAFDYNTNKISQAEQEKQLEAPMDKIKELSKAVESISNLNRAQKRALK